MRIYLKNNRAKFHHDPTMKGRNLRLYWRASPRRRRRRRRRRRTRTRTRTRRRTRRRTRTRNKNKNKNNNKNKNKNKNKNNNNNNNNNNNMSSDVGAVPRPNVMGLNVHFSSPNFQSVEKFNPAFRPTTLPMTTHIVATHSQLSRSHVVVVTRSLCLYPGRVLFRFAAWRQHAVLSALTPLFTGR